MGNTSNESVNIFALGALPNADYQTDRTLSTVTPNLRQIEKKDRTFAKYTVQTSDNRGSSTGTPHPTRKDIETHDVEFSMTEDMSSQLLGERAYAAFGQVESEEIDDGVTQHNFELINPQTLSQQPAYNYVEKAGESSARPDAHNVKYSSVVMGQWGVQGQGRGLVQMNSTWTGSGKRTVPSGATFIGGSNHVILLEEMVQNYFRNTSGVFKLYPQKDLGGSVYNVGCDFRDFEVSVNWNLQKDEGYLGCGLYQTANNPESGAIRGKLEVGDPTVTFNVTMLDNDAYDGQGKLETMASISARLDYTGALIDSTNRHKASFILRAANIADVDHVTIGNKNGWRLTTEPLAIGQVMPFYLELINNVPSYTSLPSW